jgi:putative DNA primase/helicase
MMEFIDFVRAHGLIVNDIDVGRWVRTPTTDHPRSRNGAYKYMGDVGFVQNHATQIEVSVWKPERPSEIKVDHKAILQRVSEEDRKRAQERRKAADKAQRILDECELATHPYLKRKGFEELKGNVWNQVLVVPMRVGKNLVGTQLIDEDGGKKFLKGQATNDACFVMGSGAPIYCEGYATGLSIMKAITTGKMRRSVVVCFSAGNLKRLAKDPAGLVVADNDESLTGERVAKETGLKYWISDTKSEDFNDYQLRVGLFKSVQAIKGF